MCDKKYMQDMFVAGIVITDRRANPHRNVVVVSFSISVSLVSAKVSTIFKQSAVSVVDMLRLLAL